ncbi:MAG: GNAT family N-acetyltransferase [Alphaproteobacteria bacterium]|jgi:ribosomal protein S18 acetylase RimI-like enzyme|nr:GNAT family N-acetyltransferase [Alphaproteobacteria bacterium]
MSRQDDDIAAPPWQDIAGEADYSMDRANDFEELARDRAELASLSADDLADLVRIDRKFTGGDRAAYMERKVREMLEDSGIRVSLVARNDGVVSGFVMARIDFGDFGRMEPVAVIDTIGVDPDFAGRGVGSALLSQLLANLSALQVERVETAVSRENFDLLGFLYRIGFQPSQRLAFRKTVD